mgnify:FL=1
MAFDTVPKVGRMSTRMRPFIILLTSVALLAGCSSDDGADDDRAGAASDRAATTARPAPVSEPPGTATCDDTDPTACLLPWPNDRFTRADPSTPTGRRVDLPVDGTPVNADGVHIDPTEWNRNDGFSPASNLLVHVESLDVSASKLPPVTDLSRSLDDDSGLVLVDVTTGDRVAAWAELDANAEDPDQQALIIVPATSLTEAHRYAVGLRGLVRTDGTEVEPTGAFSELVDDPDEEQQEWLDALGTAGATTDDLDIAWSFTVASSDSLSGRLRAMAAETLSEFGDGAPPFTVTSNETAGAARIVSGTFEMPRYLAGDGGPGSVLNNDNDPDGIPARNGTMSADFTCTVPAGATAADPAPMIVYGHGLLGSRSEVLGIGGTAAIANIGMCATDYLGMSAADIPTIVGEFRDFSGFRTQPDRMQQGQLAFVVLGRLLRSADGFATDGAFSTDGAPVIDTSKLAFLGASQGGILGGVASTVTDDWDKVVLAVGGLGYNLLLRRSVDFDEFIGTFEAAYPGELDQLLTLELAEQLWDRGENAGYAQHLTTDPYEGIAAKPVLALEAFGDHQVTNVSTQKLARTLGLRRREPTLAAGRSSAVDPFYGIAPLPELPTTGSALFVWDFGTPTPPDTNTPNRGGDDPHGDLGDETSALALLVSFVNDGTLIDVCGEGPCTGG